MPARGSSEEDTDYSNHIHTDEVAQWDYESQAKIIMILSTIYFIQVQRNIMAGNHRYVYQACAGNN